MFCLLAFLFTFRITEAKYEICGKGDWQYDQEDHKCYNFIVRAKNMSQGEANIACQNPSDDSRLTPLQGPHSDNEIFFIKQKLKQFVTKEINIILWTGLFLVNGAWVTHQRKVLVSEEIESLKKNVEKNKCVVALASSENVTFDLRDCNILLNSYICKKTPKYSGHQIQETYPLKTPSTMITNITTEATKLTPTITKSLTLSNATQMTFPVTLTSLPLSCGDNWKYFENTGQCYRLFTDFLKTKDAEKVCNKQGAHLASIHSLEENNFIYNMAKTGGGGNYYHNIWIGLYRTSGENGVWKNFDNTPVNYMRWAPEQSETATRHPEHCVQMFTDLTANCGRPGTCPEEHWNKFPCKWKMRAFVCKRQPGVSALPKKQIIQ